MIGQYPLVCRHGRAYPREPVSIRREVVPRGKPRSIPDDHVCRASPILRDRRPRETSACRSVRAPVRVAFPRSVRSGEAKFGIGRFRHPYEPVFPKGMSRFVMERVDSGFESLSGAGRMSGRLERGRDSRSPAGARVMRPRIGHRGDLPLAGDRPSTSRSSRRARGRRVSSRPETGEAGRAHESFPLARSREETFRSGPRTEEVDGFPRACGQRESFQHVDPMLLSGRFDRAYHVLRPNPARRAFVATLRASLYGVPNSRGIRPRCRASARAGHSHAPVGRRTRNSGFHRSGAAGPGHGSR